MPEESRQQNTCSECPCKELTELAMTVSALRMKINTFFEQLVDLCYGKKGVEYHLKDVERLEGFISKLSSTISQATAVKTSGSWGIAQQRGEVVYSRLLTSKKVNGNGPTPFLTTGDVKKILGVSNYSQAKSAIEECTKQHPDTRKVARGKKKTGIELLENVPVVEEAVQFRIDPIGRKKLW